AVCHFSYLSFFFRSWISFYSLDPGTAEIFKRTITKIDFLLRFSWLAKPDSQPDPHNNKYQKKECTLALVIKTSLVFLCVVDFRIGCVVHDLDLLILYQFILYPAVIGGSIDLELVMRRRWCARISVFT